MGWEGDAHPKIRADKGGFLVLEYLVLRIAKNHE